MLQMKGRPLSIKNCVFFIAEANVDIRDSHSTIVAWPLTICYGTMVKYSRAPALQGSKHFQQRHFYPITLLSNMTQIFYADNTMTFGA